MKAQTDSEAGRISELISRFHDQRRWIAENRLAFAIADAYPVSKGHTLIVPKRRVTSTAELSSDELLACFELVELQKQKLVNENGAQGFNVGINEGLIAGQTVEQLHFHVIPRYPGDVADPVGGVRNILPGKGNYLRES
jgi:diadenosine tetraphosphate (Ap4A) HIT family hydrolase